VILTHSHMDHVDGLKYFGNTEIIVNKKEWEARDLAYLIPEGLSIQQVELKERIENGLIDGHYITKAKDLFLIATPGHSEGHCSVVLKTDDVDIIFAGDVVYEQFQLREDTHIGVNASQKDSVQTFKKLKTYMRKYPSVFLPSHDPLALKRLENKETF
jgi:N-acyl homoserine lactone hydrolase